MDGYGLEGVFKRVKLNCVQLNDPDVQLALVLHNPQTANEVFLLSLRDCVVTMPGSHPLKQWLQAKNRRAVSQSSANIMAQLEGELKGIWASDHALTPVQRQGLIRLLDELEDLPPYLDYLVLRAVGYLKLGNWARTEKLLTDWLNEDLLVRIAQTPRRHDSLGKLTTGLAPELFESLAQGLEGHLVVDLFFQGVAEFYSDADLVRSARDEQQLDEDEILAKLELLYYQNVVPGFSAWMLNRELEGRRRSRYLEQYFGRTDASARAWIFLGRIPDEGKNREALARELALLKSRNPMLFHALAPEDGLIGVLTRVAPEQIHNLLKERRALYLQRLREQPRNAWVLKGLVELGQINEELVQTLTAP
jgi:hypothetical protein